ncbi:hypothetical protein VNI00_000106 [Paramarasmius palmivorus]|uniref:GH16 domain-containing protein n=1 Tax=Paramarasmius palmivorus TaxID=297713 RepID=A0AAW0EGR2_9AGAR
MPFLKAITSKLLSTFYAIKDRLPIHSNPETTVEKRPDSQPETLRQDLALVTTSGSLAANGNLLRTTGKVAVVTGSSRSIGAAIAKALAEEGANVVVNYGHDPVPAGEVVDAIKLRGKGDAVAVKADASTTEGGRTLLQETLEVFGRIDVLVLNAGIMGSKPLKDVDEGFFDAHFNTNVRGPLFLVKEAANLLPTPGGRVIFFSTSLTGATSVLPNALCYVASKGAIEQISRVLAKDLGAKGLTVNTISPGPVDTPLFREGKPKHVIDMIAAQSPNNRLAQPEDIAPVVTFLASPAAQWVNGQNIRVNGFLSIMPPPKHGQWSANFQQAQAPVHAQFSGPQFNTLSRQNSLNDSPYTAGSSFRSTGPSISDKFSLSPDPRTWGSDISGKHAEPDDFLHVPDPVRDRKNDQGGHIFTSRGLSNVGCLCILITGIVTLFAGYPIITYLTTHDMSFRGGFNLGGINASGQVPELLGSRGLIDVDTPSDAYTFKSLHDGSEMQLIFSDEFNKDGRSFYPGDDPYWEAVDIHYWGTNNLEWYDPEAITTANGSLKITMSKKQTHDLNYQGGMMSTWNKFCYTGGLVVAKVILPGMSDVPGLWPAIWTMGNLGRAGYGASLEGMWPYTYDACDVGTLANQTQNGKPYLATVDGDAKYGGSLSYLPGQKLSRCTCPGESHPGPVHGDGTYVGRAAPEIDVFEAQVGGNFATDLNPRVGEVSQSGQWAPFNYAYEWFDTAENFKINDPEVTVINGYKGGIFQQATSCVSKTNQKCYSQEPNPCYAIYGFEYQPGYDGYITWLNDGKQVCTIMGAGLAADNRVELSARPVPMEPMYLLANLGMSHNFGDVDFENLVFPVSMYVDYIRVYQRSDAINIGCDPKDFPTKEYIETWSSVEKIHRGLYQRQSYHLEDDYKQPFPKNKLIDKC